MKFSFFMMPLHHPTENPTLAFDRDIALIHYADELDFDEFLREHHSGGWGMPAPEMGLPEAAAHAHRIRLGTSVPVFLSSSVPCRGTYGLSDHLTRGA
jgi:alkanesulfonate monooxygenase SsuD/methylene tetrahydromethanopterin reductase-like flavin-dependent oxidoreductase (luciferase family)